MKPVDKNSLSLYRKLAGLAVVGLTSAVAQADGSDTATWNGITLYGIYDIGVAYQTHGTPLSQDWIAGLGYLIQKNSNHSIFSVAPNGLSQSKIGFKGTEPLINDVSFIFNLETGFSPQSGEITDAVGSLVHNNGIALQNQTSGSDSSRAGQLFNGGAYAGLSSKTYGTLTFGRQNTLLLDNIVAYDPMGGSYAFSLIGFSGATAGMGDTEDARLDGSVKYVYQYQHLHVGALYQFDHYDASPGAAWQANVGFDAAGFTADFIYGHKNDAIALSSLSAAQVATLPVNSLSATISDDTSYTVDMTYAHGPLKAFAGYEHIKYENPSDPLTAPFTGLGGYQVSVVNNTAFPNAKILQVYWAGLKYQFNSHADLSAAAYHYNQNSYKGNGCSDASAASCSGTLDAYSVMADYKWTKRFDTYGGVMFSHVADGLANGYLNTSTADPMIGMRFKF